jgi:energy-converting hydrogenase A subunit M
LRLQSDI